MDAQRQAILGAATDLLAEGGYAACTIAAVARRANVASGTVYNHFASKGDLAAQLFRTIAAREVAAAADAAATGSAIERITAVIDTFALRALKQPRRAYALLAEPAEPTVDALRLEYRRAFRDVIADAIASGVASGELPPQDPSVVAAALVGAIGEALVGPLAGADDCGTALPTLVMFACRAIGGGSDTDS